MSCDLLTLKTFSHHIYIMAKKQLSYESAIAELQHSKLNDLDLIELNEAFATQALAVIQEAGLNPDIVNVNGGAIALGHPLGCTGAKLSTQLFNEMRRRGNKYGMVTACVGGGQGIAGVYELLN